MKKSRFWIRLGFGVVLALSVLYIMTPSYLRYIGKSLIHVTPEPTAADIGIVLTGDPYRLRVMKGIELYKEGMIKKILITGGPILHNSAATIGKEFAITYGVPSENIIVEPYALSTYENALFSLPLTKAQNATSAIIITSSFHSKRAASVFTPLYLPEGITLQFVGTKDDIDYENWWKNHEMSEDVLIEMGKRIYYFIFK